MGISIPILLFCSYMSVLLLNIMSSNCQVSHAYTLPFGINAISVSSKFLRMIVYAARTPYYKTLVSIRSGRLKSMLPPEQSLMRCPFFRPDQYMPSKL